MCLFGIKEEENRLDKYLVHKTKITNNYRLQIAVIRIIQSTYKIFIKETIYPYIATKSASVGRVLKVNKNLIIKSASNVRFVKQIFYETTRT